MVATKKMQLLKLCQELHLSVINSFDSGRSLSLGCSRDHLVKIVLQHESRQQIYIEYISLGMTRVFVTFQMLPKIGWAESTRQKNPGAATTFNRQIC